MSSARKALLGTMYAPEPPAQWITSSEQIDYPQALAVMERRVSGIAQGQAGECVWLLEHPPIYTAGSRSRESDLILPDSLPVYETGRGGEYTYHGPGQRVAYVMLDLKRRTPDLRLFIAALEEWIIRSLAKFSITGERREDRVGVWVVRPDRAENGDTAEDKIAAIGVRIRKWITFHGISVNITPDLSHYSGIVPCGISEHGVTSLADLGLSTTMAEFDLVLRREFEQIFGETVSASDQLLLADAGTIRQTFPSEVAN